MESWILSYFEFYVAGQEIIDIAAMFWSAHDSIVTSMRSHSIARSSTLAISFHFLSSAKGLLRLRFEFL
jgi:hypothetical protein